MFTRLKLTLTAFPVGAVIVLVHVAVVRLYEPVVALGSVMVPSSNVIAAEPTSELHTLSVVGTAVHLKLNPVDGTYEELMLAYVDHTSVTALDGTISFLTVLAMGDLAYVVIKDDDDVEVPEYTLSRVDPELSTLH